MIINDIRNHQLMDDPVILADIHRTLNYPVSQQVLDCVMEISRGQQITWMFSGSWRWKFPSQYLELRSFKNAQLPWHPNTLFVEPEDSKLHNYVLHRLKIQTMVILHSDYWVNHRPLDIIANELDRLLIYCDSVICTVPIKYANFNKLKKSVEDVCRDLDSILVDDSLVIVRDRGNTR